MANWAFFVILILGSPLMSRFLGLGLPASWSLGLAVLTLGVLSLLQRFIALEPESKAEPGADGARLDYLDFVRGLAALLVSLSHGLEHYLPLEYGRLNQHVNLGAVGVTAFFVISGYIIPRSTERARSVRKFAIGRFFRIAPLYYVSLASVLALLFLGMIAQPSPKGVEWVWNLSMVQHFFGQPNALGVFWTLAYEWLFYVLIGVMLWLRKPLGILPLFALLATFATVQLVRTEPSNAQITTDRVMYLGFFLLGNVLYLIEQGRLRPAIGWLLGGVTLGAGLLQTALMYRFMEHPNAWMQSSSWALGLALFFGPKFFERMAFPKAFCWLGQISYSMYIVHAILLLMPIGLERWWAVLWLLAGTVAISAVTYRFVELPGIQFGRRVAFRTLNTAPRA